MGTTDIQTLTNKSISADQINSGLLGSAVAVRPNNIAPSSASNTPRTISVSVAPTYNFPEAFATEFDGDFSNTTIPLYFTLNGAVLGQPTTGYQWSPALTPYQTKFVNNSGWNQATGSNDGRTGAAIYRTMMQNNGQGDIAAYYTFCTVNSSRAGATTWLANPACIGMNGDFGATANGAYLQGVGDMNFNDGGFDISVIGTAFNFNRTNNTHALGEIWLGHYVHSYGTKAIDAGFTIGGPANVGFDTVTATLTDNAAFNMGQGQKIVFNSTSTSFGGGNFYGDAIGSTYMTYSGSSLLSVVGGVPTLQVSSGSALINGTLFTNAAPQIQSDHINIQTPKTPATSSAACTTGDHAWDTGFIYVCIGTNTWKRAAISTW
ncbi:hypothetical protein [Rhizobium lusitanum]|uniref:hypothetical protein n=1 Tax=Rhizobium lusitanum TaxID=293958 RepID=UPI001957E840|nr:hypothetical protein [Rhizobium lusitanum]MBM7047586.1 hypothetical protein [Rhizobium lusitanum]